MTEAEKRIKRQWKARWVAGEEACNWLTQTAEKYGIDEGMLIWLAIHYTSNMSEWFEEDYLKGAIESMRTPNA